MELTGAAASRTMEGDEESQRLAEKPTRGCSVGVERPVRTTSRNRPPEHAECLVSGAIEWVWKVMHLAEKEKA